MLKAGLHLSSRCLVLCSAVAVAAGTLAGHSPLDSPAAGRMLAAVHSLADHSSVAAAVVLRSPGTVRIAGIHHSSAAAIAAAGHTAGNLRILADRRIHRIAGTAGQAGTRTLLV